MTAFEATALGILAFCAVAVLVLGLVWDHNDRRPLDPPEPAPIQDHRPKHAAWGATTRLRPPKD
jgi:hypothetical protein